MFTDEQKKLLGADLDRAKVRTRQQGGRGVSYIEGWHAIAEANRIFGFDGWDSETTELKVVAEAERTIGTAKTPGWGVSYIAKVRITVGGVVREGVGTGHGIDRDLGQAHESAIKEAETDARKRALMTFGNPMGLALYDKEQRNVADAPAEPTAAALYLDECHRKIRDFKDVTSLGEWWTGEAEKRRDFDLDTPAVNALKERVIKRKNELTPNLLKAG